ncbi:hypothetical protein [Hamadaea tsunoensis]|uniref:hypothetical protein n=1 Tax=Hamadaea tsunoensis TaxID=53368 RepID=UPI0004290FAA|nr:hypothetical protein [Hamadaea tsunoensis]
MRTIDRAAYRIAALLVGAGLFHLAVFLVAGGPWEGPVSWRKPATFGLSFGLTLATITWVTSYLRISPRLRTILLAVFAADCVLEVLGITVQAWRGVPSHFNMSTTINRSVAMTLAFGGAVLVVVLVAFAVNALRHPPDAPAGMRLALQAGFITLLIGLASGAAMIARGVVLTNTGHQELAYRLGGFLKPVHAISLHGVLVLPALAAILARLPWPEARQVRVVALAAGGYGLAIVIALTICLYAL